MWYDDDEYPEDPKDFFKVLGLCIMAWGVIFFLMYLLEVIVKWFN